MRKVTCVVLFLIVFETCAIFNFSGATELTDKRNVNKEKYQNQQPLVVELLEEEYPDEYTNQESDISGQPIGRWRSTGKALEPKWRDGDSVPLVPFRTVTISSKSSIKKQETPDDADNERNYASGHRSSHWQSHRQGKGTVITHEYNYNTSEKPDHKNNYQGFRSRETRLSRRRKPPQFEDEERHRHPSEKCSNETKDVHETNNNNNKESKPVTRTPKLPYNNNEYLEGVALRYRETFQNYPIGYELSDEEYQRPRSRKRRPPQNDEFIEFKSSPVSSTDRSTSHSPTYSTVRSQRKQENTRRNNLLRTNHNRTFKISDKPSENSELKSLLKMQQVEGLSLSEILQRRNLTLSDLLQGKADVINLLKSRQVEEGSEEEVNSKAKAVEMMKISASSTISVSSTTEKSPHIPSKRIPAKIFAKKTDGPFSSFRVPSTHAYRKVLPTQEVQERIHPTKPMNSVKDAVSSETPFIDTTAESVNLEKKDKMKIVYDEDEIMEFSDFTVNSSKIPTTIAANNSETKQLQNTDNLNQDSESTLSIEHLLSPTMQPFIEVNESQENMDKFLEQSSERIQLENKIPHSVHEDDKISKESNSFEMEYQNDGPSDITENEKSSTESDINNSNEKESVLEDSPANRKAILNHKNDDIYFEMEPDAREEILELFNSGTSAKKLESLLKARNMSIEDLIALRKRGSSQLHLAEVALSNENNFRLPSLKDFQKTQEIQEKYENPIEVKILKPDCPPSHEVKEFIEWMKEKELKKEPEKEILHIKEFETLPPIWSDQFGNSHYSATNQEMEKTEREINSEAEKEFNPETEKENNSETEKENNSEPEKENNSETEKEFNPERIDQSDDFTNILSHFKSSQPFNDDDESSEGISFYTSNDQVPSSNLPEKKNNSVIPIEDGRVQEIVSDISNTFNNIFKFNTDDGSSDEKNPISRIRTSIIVSGAILGVTIVVFLGIFIACRVRQKKKYTYSNSFSRAVFQSPVVSARKLSNTSSLNTIMVNVVATSTTKRPEKSGYPETDDDYDLKSEIEHDSLDANDSWETIPDFMK